jgi:hypothetical protein
VAPEAPLLVVPAPLEPVELPADVPPLPPTPGGMGGALLESLLQAESTVLIPKPIQISLTIFMALLLVWSGLERG